MKKNFLILLAFVFGLTLTVNAQAPYRHSIGATLGTMESFSYKTFLTDNLALSVDAGFKWTTSPATSDVWYNSEHEDYHGHISPMTIEANPNFMYEAHVGSKGLHWLVGGGLSLGYSWFFNRGYDYGLRYTTSYGKFGINAIGGIEYKFSIPLTLQADFRPGYGLLFREHEAVSYFDWAVCVGLRYTLH
ncbi:MAG: hypothetical protein IKO62_10975 [Bacteroidales bacterium]|nr:hypothetical protein [Bacteroidales bacterium]